MRIVRGRAEAQWMPSRYIFALFRLFAYLRFRTARPKAHDVLLVIERAQSNVEVNVVVSWVLLTGACYIAELGLGSWPLALAIPFGALLANFVMQATIVVSAFTFAPLWRGVTRLETPASSVNSFMVLAVAAAGSAYCLGHPSWVRFVAWQFFAVCALNALASAILFALRGSIARLEAAMPGGTASGV